MSCLVALVALMSGADSPEATQLARLLRPLLLKHLPNPLVESSRDWGNQRETFSGLKWHRLRPEPQRTEKNDGHWERIRLEAVNPETSLAIGIRELQYPEAGKITFHAMIGVDLRATYEQQIWKIGARLYSGETRVRAHGAVLLHCEATNRLDRKPGSLLPDAVLRVRVTKAEVFYNDLVCEHTAGLGGDAAKFLGDAAIRFLKRRKPNFEQDLLAKANAAIVKAADSREIRIEFDKLLDGKAPSVTRKK